MGMVADRAGLDEAAKESLGLFNDAIDNLAVTWPAVAMEMQSGGSQTTYNWMAALPKMEEWIGPRNVSRLKAFQYTIVNKDYQLAIEITQNELDDDGIGVVKNKFMTVQDALPYHQDELVGDLYNNGFSTACYDEEFFFDTDHPMADGTTQSNDGGANALTHANVQTAIKTMYGYKDWHGKPLRVRPDTLIVGPEHSITALEITEQKQISDGTTTVDNVLVGRLKVIVDPNITGLKWFVADLSKSIKPFIFQKRKPLETSLDDTRKFSHNVIAAGVNARYNAGYGFWWLMYGSEGA